MFPLIVYRLGVLLWVLSGWKAGQELLRHQGSTVRMVAAEAEQQVPFTWSWSITF